MATLSSVAIHKINEALGVKSSELSEDPNFWTKGRAEVAADTICENWSGSSTITRYLGGLRNHLKIIEVPKEIVAVTFRPDVTMKHNQLNELSRKKRLEAGIEIPPEYLHGELEKRVAGYLENDEPLSPQMAADFLVSLSGRRKEGETLNMNSQGGIEGVSKKRKKVAQNYEVKSCLPKEVAIAFLNMWDKFPEEDRAAAIKGAEKLSAKWGLQIRDLRAIGSYLAADDSKNVGTYLQTASQALRHDEPRSLPAVMNYARVNVPNRDLFHKINQLSAADLQRVIDFVDRL